MPDYLHNLNERYGFLNKKVIPNGIMLHSVSVGEVLSVVALINIIHKNYSYLPITITTMTPAAYKQIPKTFHNYVNYFYLPYDLPGSINRFLNKIKPKLVIIMETELWPNLIRVLYNRKIPIIIANARLSIKSVYFYKKFNKFIKSIVNNITFIAAQDKENSLRFLELGIKKNKLSIIGNLKFDIFLSPTLIKKIHNMRKQWTINRKIWIAASTHQGEEKLILDTHKNLLKSFPNLLLILAPRQPARFQEVQNMVLKYNFKYVLYSKKITPSYKTQIIINDTIGKLSLLYGIADIAFVGGSLVNHGGHNPLEAAVHSIPIIMGPYTFNFNDICIKLKKFHGLINVTNIHSLIKVVSFLLINKKYRISYGRNAAQVLNKNQGALKRLLNIIQPYLS